MNPRDLPDLLIFFEVFRSGSISEGARRLHTVQTNVSARMQKLEAALGKKLLTRTSRGIRLTGAGEALLPVARRLASLVGEVDQIFPKSRIRHPVLLRIGSLETFAATHLPGLIAGYKVREPAVEFAIIPGSSRSLTQMLQESELDIAFVSHPASTEALRTELTIMEELVLFVPQNVMCAFDPKQPLANCDLPLVVQRQACSYSERLLSYARAHDPEVRAIIEAGSIETLLGFVEEGLGIAVAPRSLINGFARRIRVIPLRSLGARRWVNIHLINGQAGSHSTRKGFVEHCREHFTAIGNSGRKGPMKEQKGKA